MSGMKVFITSGFSKAKTDVNLKTTLNKRVSLCFVLDTTGSMASYISGVKGHIVQIVAEVQAPAFAIYLNYLVWGRTFVMSQSNLSFLLQDGR